jgi:hypothetical protein
MRIAWLILFGILQVVDILTTDRVLARGGSEGNPLQVLAQAHLGSMWWVPKLVLMLACAFFMAHWKPRYVMPFVALMAVVVSNNALWAFA